MNSKLNLILDETTIFNVKRIGIIINRYRFFFFIVPVITVLGSTFLLGNNKNAYFQDVTISVNKMESEKRNDEYSSFLNTADTTISYDEFNSNLQLWEFRTELSRKVRHLKSFPELHFSNQKNENVITGTDLMERCKNEDRCINEQLNLILPGLIVLNETDTTYRYKLGVATTDKKSTTILREVLISTITQYRINQLKQSYMNKRKILENIIKEKRDNILIDSNRLWKVSEAEIEMKDLSEQIANSNRNLVEIKKQLSYKKAELDGYGKLSTAITGDEQVVEKVKLLVALKADVKNLKNNIQDLNKNRNPSSVEQNLVLAIEDELKNKTKEYIEEKRSYENEISSQQNVQKNVDEAKLLAKEIDILTQTIKSEQKSLETLNKKREDMLHFVDQSKQDSATGQINLEFIKGLEKNLISLKLHEITITSDIYFDYTSPHYTTLHQRKPTLVIVCSFLFSVFAWILTVIGFYLFDKVLYDKEEIEILFSDLVVIGERPSL